MTTAEREQQRDNALILANQVRMSNAQLRAELAALTRAAGCQRVAQMMLEPSGPVLSFPVGRLLTSIDHIGEQSMIRYLRYADIFSATKRVGALTTRQRRKLADALQHRDRVHGGWV